MTKSDLLDASPRSAEKLLSNLGVKIDLLIEAAKKAKGIVLAKEHNAMTHGELALKEMKTGLEEAWSELSNALNEHQETSLIEPSSENKTFPLNDEFPGTC